MLHVHSSKLNPPAQTVKICLNTLVIVMYLGHISVRSVAIEVEIEVLASAMVCRSTVKNCLFGKCLPYLVIPHPDKHKFEIPSSNGQGLPKLPYLEGLFPFMESLCSSITFTYPNLKSPAQMVKICPNYLIWKVSFQIQTVTVSSDCI